MTTKIKETDILRIKRVSYGKKETPIDEREYRMKDRDSPIGFLKDWEKHAKQNGYKGLIIFEKDGFGYERLFFY